MQLDSRRRRKLVVCMVSAAQRLDMSCKLMPHAPSEVLCHAEDAKGERSRNRVIENELRDPSNFLE